MADTVACTSPCSEENPCFGHKLKYWRENGLQMGFTYGKDDWHNQPSVRERAKQAVADAKRAGIEPEYKGRATLI